MKIVDAISRVDALKPNQYPPEDKVYWLSKLDGQIYEEIIKKHENSPIAEFTGYDNETDINTQELLVPAPYDDLYPLWLEARIDYSNAEYGKYNNSITMFNVAYSNFANYYNRTHMPITGKIKYF